MISQGIYEILSDLPVRFIPIKTGESVYVLNRREKEPPRSLAAWHRCPHFPRPPFALSLDPTDSSQQYLLQTGKEYLTLLDQSRESERDMAGNDWVNSYLEAILDVGKEGGIDAREKKKEKASLLLRERGKFSPARYFVEEVISGFDETDLYKTWLRVCFLAMILLTIDWI